MYSTQVQFLFYIINIVTAPIESDGEKDGRSAEPFEPIGKSDT